MITPDRILMFVGAEAGRDGMLCPGLDSEQALRAAQTLIAAVGLARVEPPRALPAGPVDSPTVLLKTVQTVDPAPRQRFRSGTAQLPVHRDSGYRGYGS